MAAPHALRAIGRAAVGGLEGEHVAELDDVRREARAQLARSALVVEGLRLGEDRGVERGTQPRDKARPEYPKDETAHAGGNGGEHADDG